MKQCVRWAAGNARPIGGAMGCVAKGMKAPSCSDNRPIPSLPFLAFRGSPQFKFQLASDEKNPGLVAARRFLPGGKN